MATNQQIQNALDALNANPSSKSVTQEIDYASIMLQFNNDPDFIKLRDRYATKSFLEIMSTDRSETRHSSFLAWLLEGKDFPVKEQDHPIIHLLDILIRRESEQSSTEQSTEKLVPDDIKNMVLSRNIKSIQIHEVSTEKSVKDVSNIPSQDRLDIYIHCTIKLKNGESKEIEFIIENKVGSKENGKKKQSEDEVEEYYKKTQTERYYFALSKNAKNQDSTKIFIYLTPISNADLGNFNKLKADQKSKDEHFINISYQDILDNIIEPLLSSEDISTRIHTLLEEYVLSLSLPALIEDKDKIKQNIKGSIIMATRQADIEIIKKILKSDDYKNLIKESLYSVLQGEDNSTNGLLFSFGTTYERLLTAILRIWTEHNESDNADLKDLYKKLLKNPKDNTKFIIEYDENKTAVNKNKTGVNKIGKCCFAVEMLKAYINYHIQKNKPKDLCEEIHKNYFPNDKQQNKQQNKQYNLCIVLLEDWYNVKEGEKYWYKEQEDDVPDNIPPKIDSSRYETFESFLITKQWGLDVDKDSSFELLLKSICGKTLKDLKQEPSNNNVREYEENDFNNEWKKILSTAGITQIKIHLDK